MADQPSNSSERGTEFKHGIYRESIRLIRRLFPVFLFAIAAAYSTLFADYNFDAWTTLAILVMIWAFVSYTVLEEVLLPGKRGSRQNLKHLIGFTLLFAFIVVLPALLLLFLNVFFSELIRFQISEFEIVLNIVDFVIVLVWVLVVSVLGMALPAFVSRRGQSLLTALATGRKQFSWIAGRLIIGPCIVVGIPYIATWPLHDLLSWQPLFKKLLFLSAFAGAVALGSVVFARAYLKQNEINPELFA